MTTKLQKSTSRKSIKVSSSSSWLIHIPNDLIIHILSRLSARYLLRLRWVCKYWFNLITHDHTFTNMNLHHNQSSIDDYPMILIHNPKPYSEEFVRFNFNNDAYARKRQHIKLYEHPVQEREYKVLGSCNGLLLMSLFLKSPPDQGRVSIFLWNPCTKEFKMLPNKPIEKMNLFEISGFGYDCINDDYKVIIVPCFDMLESVMAIYSLRTNSWRRIRGFQLYNRLYMSPAMTLSNGALYSIALNRTHNEDVLLCFDIVKEEFKEISEMSQWPHPTYQNSCDRSLGDFRGCLCMFITLSDNAKVNVEVWVLMKDEHDRSREYMRDSWTKLYTITKKEFTPDGTAMTWLQPLRICDNSEVLMLVNERDVVWYNPTDDTTRFVATLSQNFYMTPSIGFYVESLVSLNTGTYMGIEQEE